MKVLPCSTVVPSLSQRSTKRLMPPRWPSRLGTLAITTAIPAILPFVAHSLRPLSVRPATTSTRAKHF